MNKNVLIVDDEPNILQGYKRQLRKKFKITIAEGAAAALELIDPKNPFSVVISDMQMPGMNGVEFLKKMEEVSPNTVRCMLTGNADQGTAVEAINTGKIFRFFSKPCLPEDLEAGINDGIRQYQLITAEKDLLEKTLAGSVKVLVDILALGNPREFGRASLVRDWVRELKPVLEIKKLWMLELAALLAPIGTLTIPFEIREKQRKGETLSETEHELFVESVQAASKLISNIPRMDDVAKTIIHLNANYEEGTELPENAYILGILYSILEETGTTNPSQNTFEHLEKNERVYHPDFFFKIKNYFLNDREVDDSQKYVEKVLSEPVSLLLPEDVLVDDVKRQDGKLILASGEKLTEAQIASLRNMHKLYTLVEPIKVSRMVLNT